MAMKCSICGNSKRGRVVAGISMCDDCFGKIQLLRNSDQEAISYFTKEENLSSATPEARQYIEHTIEVQASRPLPVNNEERVAEIESIMTTTTHSFTNYKIQSCHGVVSGIFVLGTGFLSEISSGISDMLGVQSVAFHDKVAEAEDFAMFEMKKAAHKLECNGIVGVNLNFSTFYGNMVCVVVYGTAVKISENDQL